MHQFSTALCLRADELTLKMQHFIFVLMLLILILLFVGYNCFFNINNESFC